MSQGVISSGQCQRTRVRLLRPMQWAMHGEGHFMLWFPSLLPHTIPELGLQPMFLSWLSGR